MATKIPPFDAHVLEELARLIADTNSGLTGTEIRQMLLQAGLDDVDSSNTKWKRVYNAFANWQNKHHCSNHVAKFIQLAMQPIRYIGKEELFHDRRIGLNKRLAFVGLEINDRGEYRKVSQVGTIAEAEQRADRLKHKLESRNIHPEVLKYCRAELLVNNYFHAVFEATKSIAERLRKMSGLYADGNALADTAFSTTSPLIKINSLTTDTDRSEHIGLSNLIKGVFGLIRNPTAHTPKILFDIDEELALDMMSTLSLIHKKLDGSVFP